MHTAHRRFQLIRNEDVSGCSGTGMVAEGCEFSGGRCVLSWVSGPAGARSVGVYDDIGDVLAIHGHGGRTVVKWLE